MTNIDNWRAVWNSKTVTGGDKDLLSSLIKANGFDTGYGNYSTDQWRRMTYELSNLLKITKYSNILEVGCGSGALLHSIQIHTQANIFGYDYSASLIETANKFLKGDFKVSEALINPFGLNEFDFVISHSVFQYFPSEEYAIKTIETMTHALKTGGKIALMDLNDASCENTYHKDRRKNFTNQSEYDEKYRNHSHLFYSRELIKKTLTDFGFVEIFFPKHFVPSYLNSKFRFNIIGTKK
jgi:ubiquinone/menaquinone biosynthesis C-methylase UbiE